MSLAARPAAPPDQANAAPVRGLPPADTIVALATPPGRGGIGVVRISGPDALAMARAILSNPDEHGAAWQPQRVYRRRFLDPESGAVLDDVLATYFRAPRSYTAEDVVEIAAHGSPVLLQALIHGALARGARPAEPGEFTRRAFFNGRIDLTQAEAIRDLIEAGTLYQARSAAQQMFGSVSRRLQPLKESLKELIARLEAGIDFADDDVAVLSHAAILALLDPLRATAREALAGFERARVVREGFSLALVGRPNAGKSSLFNRLLCADRAIVTATPGTTRDLVAEIAEFDGLPVRLVDTAGIRECDQEAERIGVAKAWEAAADADLVLAVFDGSAALGPEDGQLIERIGTWPQVCPVVNKSDLPRRWSDGQLRELWRAAGIQPPPAFTAVSALSGDGIPELGAALRRRVAPEASETGAWITNARHARHLGALCEALARATEAVGRQLPHEVLLIDCYAGLRELDAITGQTTVEDILGLIFSTFCVGK